MPDPTHARQWQPPSSLVLQPGERKEYALRLALADGGPASRDALLLRAGRPVLHGVPGYVLSAELGGAAGGAAGGGNLIGARLIVELPPGLGLASVSSAAPRVLMTAPAEPVSPAPASASAAVGVSGYAAEAPAAAEARRLVERQGAQEEGREGVGARVLSVPLLVTGTGRARIDLTFSDGSNGSAHYLVVPAASLQEHISRYGRFAARTAWLPAEAADPFGRQSSLLMWDREDKRHVLQDGRTFVSGLSDDAGGAAALGLAAKSMFAPAAEELARLDEYVAQTLYGDKANRSGLASPHFSLQELRSLRVRMTVFYYRYTNGFKAARQFSYPGQPDYYTELDKCTIAPSWCAFNALEDGAAADWAPADYRQYNFPHQISVYLALYLAGRNHDRLPARTLRRHWSWYLRLAAATLLSLGCCAAWGEAEVAAQWRCSCVPTVGLMDGTVFRELLLALQAEAGFRLEAGFQAEAAAAEEEAAGVADSMGTAPARDGAQGGPTYTYAWVSGGLASGNDRPSSPRNATIAQAEAACDADELCIGFTYHSATKAPSGPLEVWLKGPTVSATSDATSSHYLKRTTPVPPDPHHNPLTNCSWRLYAELVLGMMRNRTLEGTKPGQVPWNEMDAPYGSEVTLTRTRTRTRTRILTVTLTLTLTLTACSGAAVQLGHDGAGGGRRVGRILQRHLHRSAQGLLAEEGGGLHTGVHAINAQLCLPRLGVGRWRLFQQRQVDGARWLGARGGPLPRRAQLDPAGRALPRVPRRAVPA